MVFAQPDGQVKSGGNLEIFDFLGLKSLKSAFPMKLFDESPTASSSQVETKTRFLIVVKD